PRIREIYQDFVQVGGARRHAQRFDRRGRYGVSRRRGPRNSAICITGETAWPAAAGLSESVETRPREISTAVGELRGEPCVLIRGMDSHPRLDDWIAQDSIPFSVDSEDSIDAAVDRIVPALGESVELLAFAEALHGSEEILTVRNRVFQRLVEAHGYSAVVIEVTSPQARVMNDYVLGLRDGDDPAV